MHKRLASIAILASCAVSLFAQAGSNAPSIAQIAGEIDRDVWAPLVRTVATDDIAGMGAVYFPNAVLVNARSTTPIKQTLERWGKDMIDAKAKGNRAEVEFRFSRRTDNPETAFETGMFKYTVIEKSGTRTSKVYPFEQLLAKVNGKWLILMERQFAEVAEAEWEKLPAWSPPRK
jgi:hypothetical protein